MDLLIAILSLLIKKKYFLFYAAQCQKSSSSWYDISKKASDNIIEQEIEIDIHEKEEAKCKDIDNRYKLDNKIAAIIIAKIHIDKSYKKVW
jgi:hypothetical protein